MHPHPSIAARWRAALLTVAVMTVALPAARAADRADATKSRYVVLLDDAHANARAVADGHGRKLGFTASALFERGLRGYVGEMTPAAANLLSRLPGVRAVAPDAEMTTFEKPDLKTQVLTEHGYMSLPAIWGLDRIDQTPVQPNGTFKYNMTGSAVTAYVVDTGVRSAHIEFEGRVQPKPRRYDAYRATGDAQYGEDCDGHGTHVAGTVGGKTFGVAKKVQIVSVRVLDCNGSGLVSNIVNGINWMIGDHAEGAPAVANMSFGGGANTAMDNAVKAAIADGITVAIAAGNSSANACNSSPARVANAVTVGATDSTDRKASFSNYGSCVDIFGPGVNVVSAYGATTNTSAWTQLSGTSMATPHVAGVAALLLAAVEGASPADIGKALAAVALTGVVTNSNTPSPKLVYEPSNLESGKLPQATTPPPDPNPNPPPTPPTTRPCWILCLIR